LETARYEVRLVSGRRSSGGLRRDAATGRGARTDSASLSRLSRIDSAIITTPYGTGDD
jgi:hypothetical protein